MGGFKGCEFSSRKLVFGVGGENVEK